MHLENLDKHMEDHFVDSEKAIETGMSKNTEPGVVSWPFFFLVWYPPAYSVSSLLETEKRA